VRAVGSSEVVLCFVGVFSVVILVFFVGLVVYVVFIWLLVVLVGGACGVGGVLWDWGGLCFRQGGRAFVLCWSLVCLCGLVFWWSCVLVGFVGLDWACFMFRCSVDPLCMYFVVIVVLWCSSFWVFLVRGVLRD